MEILVLRDEVTVKKKKKNHEAQLELNNLENDYHSQIRKTKLQMHIFYNQNIADYNQQHRLNIKELERNYTDLFLKEKKQIMNELETIKKIEMEKVVDHKDKLIERITVE